MSDILSIISWWVVLQILGWAVWPLTFRWLRWLPDRGYMLAKPIGLLFVSYGLWLLANSAKTITTVATESGFSDISHFNRLFRATFGCAPSALRRQGSDAMQSTIQRWQAAQSEILSHLQVPLPKPACVAATVAVEIAAENPPAVPLTGLDTLGFLRRERRPYFLSGLS